MDQCIKCGRVWNGSRWTSEPCGEPKEALICPNCIEKWINEFPQESLEELDERIKKALKPFQNADCQSPTL